MNSDPSEKSYTIQEATIKLIQYCAYRDRSQKEVQEKLKEMRMIPEACEQITIQLMRENFLNEERFARSFVRGRFRIKKWGRIKIKQELKKREISEPLIKIAFSEIELSEYYSTLNELAEKKIPLIKESNPYKKKQKLVSFLHQKGYEFPIILEVIAQLKL
ncbi:regulatory protein [Gillisia sp. Hel_I_86]|uniref:regulatory protein RecX n=1 Tax=Gillisia sp. Hel_I_86 TaxID=1249981 RepID=UPI00119987FF|nr:regulatory protein RecX [Gillisia sp. Hel_I_86]TVZ26489.1 regulatory protein [Gillisia sp. Hel_I_86]